MDISAALKLLHDEKHSVMFTEFYDSNPGASWVSSALLRIEVMRTVNRAAPALLPDARDLLTAFDFVAMDDDIVDAAMNEPDRMLRSPGAIHLACARGRDPVSGLLAEQLSAEREAVPVVALHAQTRE